MPTRKKFEDSGFESAPAVWPHPDWKPGEFRTTIDDAAETTSVPCWMIYRAIHAGNLPSYKVGRKSLIKLTDLERFVANLPRTVFIEKKAE